MNRLAHDVVAAERKRHVADTTAHERVWQARLYFPRRLDKVETVAGMCLDAGRHGKDIGIEDDIGRVEADLVDEHLVRPLADLELALDGIGLALFVECHDDDGRAVIAAELRLFDERVFAFLETDRVDDRLALHAL